MLVSPVAAVSAAKVAGATQTAPRQIARWEPGMLITPEQFNEVVDAINEIRGHTRAD
jgi:hypothetical protein